MSYVESRQLKKRSMPEGMHLLDRSLTEISDMARQTLNLLALTDKRPDPGKYQDAMRNAHALRGMWAKHIESESDIFAAVLFRDPHFAAFLDRIAAENKVIDRQLTSLCAAPWPRSPQAGVNSIRMSATKVLADVLTQVDRERLTILPLMRRWLPEGNAERAPHLVTTGQI